jgi:hypothetical protein
MAFLGAKAPGSGEGGAFLATAEGIVVVADENTPVPGGTGNFTGFIGITAGSNSAIFFGSSPQRSGLYEHTVSGLSIRADTGTAIPNGAGSFASLSNPSRLRGSQFAFSAKGSGAQEGVYLSSLSGVTAVVDTHTPVPGVTGATFSGLSRPGLDEDGFIAFLATMGGDASKRPGIYGVLGANITRLVGVGDPAPGSSNPFTDFNTLSLEGGRVLFQGFTGTSESTIYLREQDGTLRRIVGSFDEIDGRFVDFALIQRESLSGDQLTFYARFIGGYEAVYTVTIPGPGGLALGALGAVAGLGIGRRRA